MVKEEARFEPVIVTHCRQPESGKLAFLPQKQTRACKTGMFSGEVLADGCVVMIGLVLVRLGGREKNLLNCTLKKKLERHL